MNFNKLVLWLQLLVGSVVIGAELCRDNHDSILATAIGTELKPLDARTIPEPDSKIRFN
jgi:hypothetical protein